MHWYVEIIVGNRRHSFVCADLQTAMVRQEILQRRHPDWDIVIRYHVPQALCQQAQCILLADLLAKRMIP